MVRGETSAPDSGPDNRYVNVPPTVLQPTQQEHFRRIFTPEYGRSISGSPVDPSSDATSLDHNQSVPFAVIKPPKFFLHGAGITPTTATYSLQKKNSTCGQIVGDITEKALVRKPDKFHSSYCASSRSSRGSIDPSSPPHREAENLATGRVQATIVVSSVQPSSCQTATVLPVSSGSSNNRAPFEDRDLPPLDRIRLPLHENHPSLPRTSSMSASPSSFPSGKAQSIPEPSPPELATVLYMSSPRANGEEAQKPCGKGEIKTEAGRMEGGTNSPLSISPVTAAYDARTMVPDTSQASDLFPPQSSGVDAKKVDHRKPMCHEKDGTHLSFETDHRFESVCFVPDMKPEVDSTARSDDAKQRKNKIVSDALHRDPSGIQPVTSTAFGRVHCRDLYNRFNSMLSEGFISVPDDAAHVNPPVLPTNETEAERFSSSSEPTSICVEGNGSSPLIPVLPGGSGTKCSEISSCPQGHQDAAVTGKDKDRALLAVGPEQRENWEARRNFCWASLDSFRPPSFRQRTDEGVATEGNELAGCEAGSMPAATLAPNGRRSFALEKHPTMPACVSGTSRKSASPDPNGVKEEPEDTLIPGPPLETTAGIASGTRGTSQGANCCHFGNSVGACQAKNCDKCDFENGGTRDQSAVGCHQRAACEYKMQQEQPKTPSTEGSDRTILTLSTQSRTECDTSKLSTLNIPAPIQDYGPFHSLEDHSCPKLPTTRRCPSLSKIGDRLAPSRVQCSHEAHLTGTTSLSGEVVPHAHHLHSRKREKCPQHGTVVRKVPVAPLSRTNVVSLPLYQDPPTLMESNQVMSWQVEQQHQVLLDAKLNKCQGRKETQHENTPAHVEMAHVQAMPACRPKSSNQCVSEELGDILLDHQQQGTPHRLPVGIEGKTRSCCAAEQCASRGLDQVRAGCEMRGTSLGDASGIEKAGIPTSATTEYTVHIPTKPQGTATDGSLHSTDSHLEMKDACSPSAMSAVSNLSGHSIPRTETAVGKVKEEKCSYSVPERLVPLLLASMPHEPSMSDISANSPASTGVCVSVLGTRSYSIPEQKPSSKSLPSPSVVLPLACLSKCAASVPAQRDLRSPPCDSSLLKEVSRLRSSGETPEIALQKHAAGGAAQRQVCEAPREVDAHVFCMPSPHDAKRRRRPGTSLSDWLSRLPVSEEDAAWITSNVDDFIRRKNSRQHAVTLPSDTPPSPRGTTEAFPDSGEDRQEKCGLVAEDLDLHLVEADVSRQRWINHGSVAHSEGNESERQKDIMVQLVTDAVCIFCTMNGACYWQGMHDLCAAFLFLSPRPSLSQLVQLLHAFLLLFAPWLLLPPQESIAQSANAARLFRQFLQFFSPGVTNEVERLIPSITWSQSILIHTLGFSRFRDVHALLSMWRCLLELHAPENSAPSGYFFFLLAYFELHKEELRIFPELIINSDVPFDHTSFSQTRCPACHGANTSCLIGMPARGDETLTSLIWQRPFPHRHILHRMLKLYSLTPPAALLDLQSLLATCSSLAQSSVQRRRILRAYPWSTSPLLLERSRGNRTVCSAEQIAQPTGDSIHALTIEPEAGVGRDENGTRTTSRLSGLQSSLCLSLNPGDLLAELRDPLVFQRPSFLNSALSEWLVAPPSCEVQSLRNDHCFEELLYRIRGKMRVISPYQASTCLSLLSKMSSQESPTGLNDSPSRFACDKNDTSPLKTRDITVVVPLSHEAPVSQQAHADGPTDTTVGGTVATFSSGQRSGDIWTSELIEVHFVDLRSTAARQRGPTLEKLLGLKPGRLPGGAKYRVVSVATSSSVQEATCSRDCGNSVVDPQDGRDSLAVRRSRVTRPIEGESRSETRSTSIRSHRPPRDPRIRGMHTMRRHRGRAPHVTGGVCHAREQSAIASEKTRQSTCKGERTTQSQLLLSPRNVLVAGRGAWLMRRRSKQGISRKGASAKLATGEDLARTDRSGVQARDGEAPNKNCLSLDELIDSIRTMNNNAPNVMRIWLLIPHEDSVNESLLEEGLLHPEASRSEMSALQEAYFRLTCAGIEGVLALNGGFAALERAMELEVASGRSTSMDVACVNSSTPSVPISGSAGPSGASALSPQHLVDSVGNGTAADRHQAHRSAEKLEVSTQTRSQGEDIFLALPRIQRLQRRRRKIRSCAIPSQARVNADTCLPNTPTSALRGVGQAIATWLFPTKEASGTAGNHEIQGETHLQVSGERRSPQATGIIKVMASSQKQKVQESMPPLKSSGVSWPNGETSCTGNTSLKQSRTVRKATHFIADSLFSSGPDQQFLVFHVPEETSPNFPRAVGSSHPVDLSLSRPHSQPQAKISVDKCVDVASSIIFPASACSGLGRPLNRCLSPIHLGDQGLLQMQEVALSGSFSRVTHCGSLLASSRQMTAVPANIVSTRKALCRLGLDSLANGIILTKERSTVVNKSYPAKIPAASLLDIATHNG